MIHSGAWAKSHELLSRIVNFLREKLVDFFLDSRFQRPKNVILRRAIQCVDSDNFLRLSWRKQIIFYEVWQILMLVNYKF